MLRRIARTLSGRPFPLERPHERRTSTLLPWETGSNESIYHTSRGPMLFEMNRVLMCRNHPVLEFAYSSNAGLILEVGDVFDPSRVPVGMYVDGQPRPDSDSVTAWWRSRGIPATRDGLRTLLMATGIPSGKELLDRSMGLSLSDQYWIRPAGQIMRI